MSQEVNITVVTVQRMSTWERDPDAVRRDLEESLRLQLASRGLRLAGRPTERVVMLFEANRARVVLSAPAERLGPPAARSASPEPADAEV